MTMSNKTLVERLRSMDDMLDTQAADRIEELESLLKRAKVFAARLWAEDPFALVNEFESTWQAVVEDDDD